MANDMIVEIFKFLLKIVEKNIIVTYLSSGLLMFILMLFIRMLYIKNRKRHSEDIKRVFSSRSYISISIVASILASLLVYYIYTNQTLVIDVNAHENQNGYTSKIKERDSNYVKAKRKNTSLWSTPQLEREVATMDSQWIYRILINKSGMNDNVLWLYVEKEYYDIQGYVPENDISILKEYEVEDWFNAHSILLVTPALSTTFDKAENILTRPPTQFLTIISTPSPLSTTTQIMPNETHMAMMTPMARLTPIATSMPKATSTPTPMPTPATVQAPMQKSTPTPAGMITVIAAGEERRVFRELLNIAAFIKDKQLPIIRYFNDDIQSATRDLLPENYDIDILRLYEFSPIGVDRYKEEFGDAPVYFTFENNYPLKTNVVAIVGSIKNVDPIAYPNYQDVRWYVLRADVIKTEVEDKTKILIYFTREVLTEMLTSETRSVLLGILSDPLNN